MKKNPVVHFEMPAKDKKRVCKFYDEVFGWGMQLVDEMGEYILATTSPVDKKGMHKRKGAINGGFFEYAKVAGRQYPSIVIAVDDIKKAMKDVAKAGGKVLGGQKKGVPDDIAGIGLYCAFIDSEGNRVGMLQPSPSM